ncbi:hypothetical protein Dimus_012123 [Dionaea muscipula]
MVSNTARLILSRSSSASARWMCTSTPAVKNEAAVLYRKLRALALGHTDAKVADALDEWVKEGHSVRRKYVIGYVHQFRKFKKYDHAIQLYEWMDKSNSKLNNVDAAIRIDLLAKTVGIAAAEEYFNSLERTAQTKKTYGALLSCFCREKMLEKAEELFQKMSELNLQSNTLNYNNMMSLYLNVGLHEKVTPLFLAMEKDIILPDMHTYNHLINSYAAAKDLEAVERVLKLMKTKNVALDWFTYGNLATIYFNAGLIHKTNAALKKLEKKMKSLKDPEAFHTLIRLYGLTSNTPGVERAWESLKLTFPKPNNSSYLVLLLALSKLGEIDSLEKYFREWESAASFYDIRLPNVLLQSYLNRDMVTEANVLYESVSKRGIDPSLTTLNLFMEFHLKKREVDLALKYLESGASKVKTEKHKWFPKAESVNAFVTYFEEEKDSASASKFSDILKKINHLDSETEERLSKVSG